MTDDPQRLDNPLGSIVACGFLVALFAVSAQAAVRPRPGVINSGSLVSCIVTPEIGAEMRARPSEWVCLDDGTGHGKAVHTMTYMSFAGAGMPSLTVSESGVAHCNKPILDNATAHRMIGSYAGIYLAICNPPRKK